MNLQTRLSEGNRSLKMYAKRLEKLDIYTYSDLLYHIPSRYEDFSLTSPIEQLQEGEKVTVQGRVLESKNTYTRRGKTLQKVTLSDNTGNLDLIWFNQPYIAKNFSVGDEISVSGRVELFQRKLTMISPEYEVSQHPGVHTGRIIPIYPETKGVSSKWLRRQIALLLTDIVDIPDFLPEELRLQENLPTLFTAVKSLHFPSSLDGVTTARDRLAFDELFLLNLTSLERRKQWKTLRHSLTMTLSPEDLQRFVSSLPFSLTPSQEDAIKQIVSDMSRNRPMNRLLQGDVGSGKTVIAASGAFIAYKNGYQSALMAPTEILAQQHFTTLTQFLSPLGISVGLATSSTKLDKNTAYDLVVGTHALVAKKVNFEKLGFIAIDEQQRFGVEQRGILREKGDNPHLLTMTATPIPRTAALTLYGELDASYLTDMPKGRKPIKTWLVPQEKREGAYDWIRKQVEDSESQVFIICPFIEESENMQTVKAATTEFDRLAKDVFPQLKLGLLHGKLKAKEKESILTAFKNRAFDILVATPVVEVGIDVPNATVILIEGSERFGLAQLHQLRGRVGRGDKQSYCLLFTEATNEQTILRLKALESMSQGAALAEFDLKMRGPGDMYGLKQSGVRMLKIASFADTTMLKRAKSEADSIFPRLHQFPMLEEKVKKQTLTKVTPD